MKSWSMDKLILNLIWTLEKIKNNQENPKQCCSTWAAIYQDLLLWVAVHKPYNIKRGGLEGFFSVNVAGLTGLFIYIYVYIPIYMYTTCIYSCIYTHIYKGTLSLISHHTQKSVSVGSWA